MQATHVLTDATDFETEQCYTISEKDFEYTEACHKIRFMNMKSSFQEYAEHHFSVLCVEEEGFLYNNQKE